MFRFSKLFWFLGFSVNYSLRIVHYLFIVTGSYRCFAFKLPCFDKGQCIIWDTRLGEDGSPGIRDTICGAAVAAGALGLESPSRAVI